MNHYKSHPTHLLPIDGTLENLHMTLLAEHCSSQAPDPRDSGLTVFTFLASDVYDVRDRVIVADPANGRYTTARATGCVCEFARPPIECECWISECTACNQPFTAIESACDSIYCLYDECPLCSHQREGCYAEDIETRINEARQESALKYPEETAAHHMYEAIANVLGSGSGDAPNYPIARRILGRITQTGPDESEWVASDGSVINVNAKQPAWLDLH